MEVSDDYYDPLLLRILALALLTAGASRSAAQALVARNPANTLLRQALDDSNWNAPPISADFASGASEDLAGRPDNG